MRLTADRTGLTTALSRVLRRDGFAPGHDRARVLTDTAVMMADGGNTVRGIDVLRHQRDLLGEVASPATVSRALAEVDQATLERVDAARAQVRARVAVPLAVGDSGAVLAEPAGGRPYHARRAGANSTFTVSGAQSRGLPAGVARVTFADSTTGWALSSAGRCANGKQNCTVTDSLVLTTDGGDTWRPVLRWEEKVG